MSCEDTLGSIILYSLMSLVSALIWQEAQSGSVKSAMKNMRILQAELWDCVVWHLVPVS